MLVRAHAAEEDHGYGRKTRPSQREKGAIERASRDAAFGARNDQDAYETQNDRAPPIGVDPLRQHEGGENHDE